MIHTDKPVAETDFRTKARALADAGKQLYQRGWVPATSGNFSMRLSADSAIVTASGRHKGQLTDEDFLAVDLRGQALSAGNPSAETLLHTQLYTRFPEVGAVLHCHSPAATVLSRSLAPQRQVVLRDYELLKAFAGITTHATELVLPIFENTQDIAALAGEVDSYLAQQHCAAYLIRGHGVYCWSDDLDTCLRQLEALNFLLQCELETLRLRR